MSADDPPEPVVLPIEDTLDLHPFQPREVKELLDDYLVVAHEKGFREVRIIHGKGSGVLRAASPFPPEKTPADHGRASGRCLRWRMGGDGGGS